MKEWNYSGSTKSKITKDRHDGNISHLEIIEVVLFHSSIANNDYQKDSIIKCILLYTFVCNKSFGQLLDMSPKNFVLLKTFNPEFL